MSRRWPMSSGRATTSTSSPPTPRRTRRTRNNTLLRMFSLRNSWRWWVCGLLLLATLINYMDRLTLNLLAPHIKAELGMGPQAYGTLEAGFAIAFACGGLLFGLLADRYNVFWVYPLAVIAWSAA